MTTARDIITSALSDAQIIGVGQTPLAEDMNDGLVRLNRMIGTINRRRWLVFHLQDIVALGNGTNALTVGAGGNFNVTRPDRIESAYFRKNAGAGNPLDYPLMLLPSREDYSHIAMKNLTTWPQCGFYDASYPTGTLYIYPVPDTTFEVHIVIKSPLTTLSNLSTILSLPPEYEEFLHYQLALRFCGKYGVEAPNVVAAMARSSAAAVRNANINMPLLQMPAEVSGKGISYNIFSDR